MCFVLHAAAAAACHVISVAALQQKQLPICLKKEVKKTDVVLRIVRLAVLEQAMAVLKIAIVVAVVVAVVAGVVDVTGMADVTGVMDVTGVVDVTSVVDVTGVVDVTALYNTDY